MSNQEIVYFELNNWFGGRDYPNEEPFLTWCGDDSNLYFSNEEWVKDNKLVVLESYVDMSVNWCVTATKDWVLNNCPKLLSDESTEVVMVTRSKDGESKRTESYPYSSFLRYSDKDGIVYGRFDDEFRMYTEENIGTIEAGEWH